MRRLGLLLWLPALLAAAQPVVREMNLRRLTATPCRAP